MILVAPGDLPPKMGSVQRPRTAVVSRRRSGAILGIAILGLALSSCSEVALNGSTRQFSGVWLYEFEGSTFVEAAKEIPKVRPDYRKSDWLEALQLEPLITGWSYDEIHGCYPVQPFLVSFTGRRSYRPFGVGHLGLWRSEVTVQRMIALERIGPGFCYHD